MALQMLAAVGCPQINYGTLGNRDQPQLLSIVAGSSSVTMGSFRDKLKARLLRTSAGQPCSSLLSHELFDRNCRKRATDEGRIAGG